MEQLAQDRRPGGVVARHYRSHDSLAKGMTRIAAEISQSHDSNILFEIAFELPGSGQLNFTTTGI